jgi:hypothetical protein
MTEDAERQRWGCPDWRSADAYPKSPDDLADWEWRWEFLRRTQGYRRYWTSLPRPSGPKISTGNPGFDYRTPPAKDIAAVRQKYSLYLLPDPCAKKIFQGLFDDPVAAPMPIVPVEDVLALSGEEKDSFLKSIAQYQHWPARTDRGLSKDSVYFLSFDVSRSIDSQLEIAGRQLRRIQSQSYPEVDQIKKQRERWPLWLRVIDAWDQEPKLKNDAFWDHLIRDPAMYEKYIEVNQPRPRVSQWKKSALECMEKAARLL